MSRLGDLDALKEELGQSTVTIIGWGKAVLLDRAYEIIDNAPAVETDIEVVAKDAYEHGYTDGWKERFGEPDEIHTVELADEVWKLYEKHHSHLATNVYEFGEELKELLGKYRKGGAE